MNVDHSKHKHLYISVYALNRVFVLQRWLQGEGSTPGNDAIACLETIPSYPSPTLPLPSSPNNTIDSSTTTIAVVNLFIGTIVCTHPICWRAALRARSLVIINENITVAYQYICSRRRWKGDECVRFLPLCERAEPCRAPLVFYCARPISWFLNALRVNQVLCLIASVRCYIGANFRLLMGTGEPRTH